jgi:phosphonate transport system substrate-binding protein
LSHLIRCLVIFVSFAAFLNIGCTKKEAPLGSEENPIKFFVVPSVDAKVLEEKTKVLKTFLEANTPYKYKFSIPMSFIAVVEAFGTDRADVASLNTFGYILANERYGTQARITLVRFGDEKYRSQIIASTSSGINSIQDLAGKKFAFVDPASTSGYLLPLKYLKDASVALGETVFAYKHDNVVTMIYQGQVEAGATFYSPPQDGKLEDARRLVKTQFPDVEEKVKIITLTDPIPNDPIVFRKDLPEEMKSTIVKGLIAFIKSEEGKKAFHEMYGATDLKESSDSAYDDVRAMLKALGKSASELTKN